MPSQPRTTVSRRAIVNRLDVAAHAGQKAPADVREVARGLGFTPVDLAPFTRTSRRGRAMSIGRAGMQALLAVPTLARSEVLLAQHPLGRANDVVLSRLARRSSSISLVHDLESLRRPEYAQRERQRLGSYDVVVVHTPAMAEHMRLTLPGVRTVVLGCFDYLVHDPPRLPEAAGRPEALYVVGRLGTDKAAYLYDLPDLPLPVRAYGPDCLVERLPAGVSWRGQLAMNRPSPPARDGFGVVWDGTSALSLEGAMGEYLRYNSPHKFSLYVILGLPVIVSRGSALAELVVREGVGLVADSLPAAAQEAAACTPERWAELTTAVLRLRARLLTGDQTRTALTAALALVDR